MTKYLNATSDRLRLSKFLFLSHVKVLMFKMLNWNLNERLIDCPPGLGPLVPGFALRFAKTVRD